MNKLVAALEKIEKLADMAGDLQIGGVAHNALAEHRAEPSADGVERVARAIEKVLNASIDKAIDTNAFPEIKSDELAKAAIAAMQGEGA